MPQFLLASILSEWSYQERSDLKESYRKEPAWWHNLVIQPLLFSSTALATRMCFPIEQAKISNLSKEANTTNLNLLLPLAPHSTHLPLPPNPIPHHSHPHLKTTPPPQPQPHIHHLTHPPSIPLHRPTPSLATPSSPLHTLSTFNHPIHTYYPHLKLLQPTPSSPIHTLSINPYLLLPPLLPPSTSIPPPSTPTPSTHIPSTTLHYNTAVKTPIPKHQMPSSVPSQIQHTLPPTSLDPHHPNPFQSTSTDS